MLAVFETAARLGSFTAAAAELGMNQSAVSRHIGALEGAIGHELFNRSPNRAALNTNGELLLSAVQVGFDSIGYALDAIAATGPTFLLTANPGFAQQWLVPHLDQLQEQMIDTDLRLRLFDRDAELTGEAFDVAIHLTSLTAAPAGSRVLFEERVLPVAAPDFAESAGLGPNTPPQELLEVAKLHLDNRDRQWMNWATWFSAHGLTWSPLRARLSYNNHALVMNEAMAGRGVALAWRGLVDDLLDTGALVPVGPDVHRPDMAYQVIPSSSAPPEAVDRVADWLRELTDGRHSPDPAGR